MSQIHCVRKPSTINMTTDDPVIQEACRQSFHNHGQMVELLGKKYICMNYMGGGNEFVLSEIFIVQPAKPEVAEWNGEGLPPVGTVCEMHIDGQGWERGTVACHIQLDEPVAVAHNGIEVFHGNIDDFRPIRTPEQIAAEAYQRNLGELADHIAGYFGFDDPRPSDVGVAEYLLDHGYRKFEIVEGE